MGCSGPSGYRTYGGRNGNRRGKSSGWLKRFRPPNPLIAPPADKACDTGDDSGLLAHEAVRRAALAGVETGLRSARPSGDGHHLLPRAVGPRRDIAHETGRRARAVVGGM